MNFVAAGLSDVGLERDHNEDSFCIASKHRLFVVADGMGGHRAGDVASRIATHVITTFFDQSEGAGEDDQQDWPFGHDERLTLDQNRLVTAVKLANQQIFESSLRHAEVQGMGTTVVCAVFSRQESTMQIAHVGDSRAYRIRNGEITQLTRDHSLVNDYLLAMPNLTDAQKRQLPDNVITRALGMQKAVAVDLYFETVEPNDSYVFCSDGLNAMVRDDMIQRIVTDASEDVEGAAKKLVATANKNGGEDNVSVLVVRIGDH